MSDVEALIRMVPEHKISASEETDPDTLTNLFKKIVADGYWTHPIVLEEDNLVVMDGHHRLAVARSLKLRAVPAVLYSYRDVRVESRRDDRTVSPAQIIRCGLTNTLMPAKTTRHCFPTTLTCSIALSDLM
ncbi:ParB N-terminal domain-containing protein [Beijerinckia sp. L45]|uniref:ParB N-terminal domain-containing protein n=1 Tax=Beijerinckia sp. L45 TaxID=1641855 RepID=UPI00131D11CC|nr:ParB N-terminal domain-containing protein [Beijerinckia sp. L45]